MKLPSKNYDNYENERFHYSVRPDPATPGPRKLRVVFPHTSVLSKPPQLPYGAKYLFLGGWGGVGSPGIFKGECRQVQSYAGVGIGMWGVGEEKKL